MKAKRKYYFRKDLENISKKEGLEYLHKNTFNRPEFEVHIKRAAFVLNIDEGIVRDVVKSYITNVFQVINTVRKTKTKINIYGFFSFVVKPGRRI